MGSLAGGGSPRGFPVACGLSSFPNPCHVLHFSCHYCCPGHHFYRLGDLFHHDGLYCRFYHCCHHHLRSHLEGRWVVFVVDVDAAAPVIATAIVAQVVAAPATTIVVLPDVAATVVVVAV